MLTVNIKTMQKCAVCKYWYDPTNSCIEPKLPKQNLWLFDDKARRKCLQKNIDMPAVQKCSKFECKLEIIKK